MPQTDGSIRSTVGTTVRGIYRSAGVVSADLPLKVADIKRFSATETVLQYGTGSGYIDREIITDRAIPASSSVTYDLYTGTDLVGLQDESAPFRTVKYLEISVLSGGDTSGVRIGGAASNEWVGFFVAAGDKQDIFPSGPPFVVGSPAGKAVTSTTKNLKIENLGAAEVVVRIVIGGSINPPGGFTGLFGGLLTYP